MDTICFERGIDIDQNKKEKLEELKLWLTISNLENVPHSLLLFSRIKDFLDENHDEIDEDETPEEVLMKSKESLYSLEKIEVFDKTCKAEGLYDII